MSVYTNLYYNQPIVVLDTTTATGSSGSLVLYGGFSANGNSILSTTNISGITRITNVTQSTTTSNGALIVSGGIGVMKNLNVGGNVIINGTLTAGSFATDNISVINLTTSNLIASNITSSNVVATSMSASNVSLVNLSSGSISASGGSFNLLNATLFSGANMSLSGDVFIGGTLTTVNITTTNLLNTNFSGAIAYVSQNLSAIGNSNTLGNIFTTAGNVGINTNTPSYLLDVNGDVRLGNLTVGSIIMNTLTAGSMYISGNVTAASNFVIDGPAFKIPSGDILARPAAPQDGYVRYNSETQQFEGYGPGSAWGSLGGVIDIAQTTKVLASASPSTTDGNLYFITVDQERMRINSSGNIGIGTSAPNYKLDIIGNLGVSTDANILGKAIINNGITTGSLNVTGSTLLGSSVFITGPELKIPTGNILARPAAPQDGYVRYNTETQQFEGYGPGSAWGSLGGVIDIAQTTKVLASASPSTTDGNLYFITVDQERMRINSSGNIGIGTSAPNYTLDVIGDLGVSAGITTVNFTTSNIVANTVDVTPSLGDLYKERSFSAANNQAVEASITNFSFSNTIVRSFNANVSIAIVKTSGTNLYANYDIRGIQKDTGEWVLNASFVGDNTNIIFSISNIDSKGQIQYTSDNVPNWESTTIKFRANTTTM